LPDGPALWAKIQASPGFAAQQEEWQTLGMLDDSFQPAVITLQDTIGDPRYPRWRYLPLDTAHFPDVEGELIAAFDHLDQQLDGWLIHSENYQALNTILPKFRERIKTIYIDPPYNTGKDDFIYEDQIQSSTWLTALENRLTIARQLLSVDGIFFASIGREQVFEFEQLLNLIFGSDNQLGDLIWEKGRKNDAKYFSLGHDYLLVYARNEQHLNSHNIVWREEKPGAHEILEEYRRLKKLHGDDHLAIQKGIRKFYKDLPKKHPALTHRRYNNVDKNGIWRDDNMSWPGGNGPRYDVVHPITKKPCKVPDGGWRFATSEKFNLYLDHEFIEFRKDHSEPPILKRYLNYVPTDFDQDSKRKRNVLSDSEQETNVQVMPSVFYKNQQPPVLALRHMMGSDVFSNPKDPDVLIRFFNYIADKQDVFLDFFGGSGTTAHAIMNLNRADGGRRKYILVEMGAHFRSVILPRVKKAAFSDQWKEGQAKAEGQGLSHFVKYYALEQYEESLQRARYKDGDLFHNPHQDPYHAYVFLNDPKQLADTLEIEKDHSVRFSPEKLYADIDLAETLSNLSGQWIRRLTPESVEFENGESVSLTEPDWQQFKPLIWWGE
jgi:adenine-specific DNA-methyltransferase